MPKFGKRMGWDDEDDKWVLRAEGGTPFCEVPRRSPGSWDDWPADTCILPTALGLLARLLKEEALRLGVSVGDEDFTQALALHRDSCLAGLVLEARDFLKKVGYLD